MNEAAVYTIPSPAAEFFKVVHEGFRNRLEALPACVTTYYDTFDWRVYRAGAVLQSSQDEVNTNLTWIAGDDQLRCKVGNQRMPGFAWELPPGALREGLSPVVKMRRLLPVVHVEKKGLVLHVLGAAEKTVARIRLLDSVVQVPGELHTYSLPSTLEIIQIKGYEKAFGKLLAFVEKKAGLSRESANSFQRALQVVNIVPGEYTSKLRVKLDPAMNIGEAAKTIHSALLQSILANEEGTRQDLDSEFLHDIRVAVRRTRSALSQIKKVFPEKSVRHFGKEFSWLGGITGPKRDIDVYLLKMEDYKSVLPESVREDLKPLYEFLKGRQEEEHRRLVEVIDSERYKKLLQDWQQFLDEPISSDAPPRKAAEPVLETSSKRIWKVYGGIIEKGNAIDDQSPAVALHELRIECKRLRYLLEFFRSLYEAGKIRQLVKSLRMLQDNLGNFNDCDVQQATLKRFAQNMLEEGKGNVETLMAMGRLVERLEIGQQEERKHFSRRFAKFASPGNEKRFHALFSFEKVVLVP
jgi:CHAD domain-containing protein